MSLTSVGLWSLVALIGGLGSVLRMLVDQAVTRRLLHPFPYGILAVNVSGAALLGFVGGLALSHQLALLIGTAGVGAYTTFSTWMLQTHELLRERRLRPAIVNIVASVVLGFTAVLAGAQLAAVWN